MIVKHTYLFTYALCLIPQCSRLFEDGYVAVHLSGNKAISVSGLIIGEVVNKPVIVSVFGSEYFNLQLEGFVMVSKLCKHSNKAVTFISGNDVGLRQWRCV